MGNLCLDLRKQLSLVFGKPASDIDVSPRIILFIILILNIAMGLISIPAVIKMGNWYTKTLKEVYYEDEQTTQISDPEVKKEKEEKEKILKQKSISTVRILNYYLISMLAFLTLSHSYVHQFVPPFWCDILRILLMAFMVFAITYTLKDAIEFNGSFAYRFLAEYMNTEDEERKKKLKDKIIPFIYLIWYHKFQFMFRIIIPLILFVILIDAKYAHNPVPLTTPIISESHCGINTD